MNAMELESLVDSFCDDIEPEVDLINDKIRLEHKVIKDAINEQIALQIHWEKVTATVSSLYDRCKLHADEAYSKAFREIMTNDNRSWSSTEAKILTDSNESYLQYKRIELKCYSLLKDCQACLKSIDSRKYLLKNYTDLVIKDCENYII